MRPIRGRADRGSGIARNVNPALRVPGAARSTRNPYEAVRAVRLPPPGSLDAYRRFIRRVLQPA